MLARLNARFAVQTSTLCSQFHFLKINYHAMIVPGPGFFSTSPANISNRHTTLWLSAFPRFNLTLLLLSYFSLGSNLIAELAGILLHSVVALPEGWQHVDLNRLQRLGKQGLEYWDDRVRTRCHQIHIRGKLSCNSKFMSHIKDTEKKDEKKLSVMQAEYDLWPHIVAIQTS